MEKRSLLAYRTHAPSCSDIWKSLASRYSLWFTHKLSKSVSYLRQNNVACIIMEIPPSGDPPLLDDLTYFRSNFRTIPIVVCCSDSLQRDIRLDLNDGHIRFVSSENQAAVKETIISAIAACDFVPDWTAFGIDYDHCSPRIKKALGILQGNFLNDGLSMNWMALQLGVHRCHFEREFRQSCGISPKQLLIGLRLHYATFLMRNDGLKLLHIAERSGFRNYYEFSKIFRRHMNGAPRQYRAKWNELDFAQCFRPLSGKATGAFHGEAFFE